MVVISNDQETTEVTDDRLGCVSSCLSSIAAFMESASPGATIGEKAAVERARVNLGRIARQRRSGRLGDSNERSLADTAFADSFLDSFTSRAFLSEMDSLRVSEGEKMTEAHMTTLAESIRWFGLGLSKADREVFMESSELSSS